MSKSIPIRVQVSDGETVSKGLFDDTTKSALVQVDLAILKSNLARLREDVAELLEAEEEEAGYLLREIEVGVEISAQGGVNLIGSLTVAGKAAIKLKFARG
jgi:hypothetical protein